MFLTRLLDKILSNPDAEKEFTDDVDKLFGIEVAVFIADMSGFSRITDMEGIIAAMLKIRKFQMIGEPIIKSHGGTLVKTEADNLYAIFPKVEQAQKAANVIINECACSVGIGYGRILWFEGDLWGDEVNQASKMGENLAKSGQVLFTASALEQLMGE